MNFTDKVNERMKKVGNVLVVGLDTDAEKLPAGFSKDAGGVLRFNRMVIESTKDIACAYKMNSAFYEVLGPDGMKTLLKTRELIGDIPTVYDVKRGDISSTARAYAKAAFDIFGFDSVTLSAYMGADAIEPFLEYANKYAFVVCLSSNPSAADFEYHGNPPLYAKVAEFAAEKNERTHNCGLVVGATVAEKLSKISGMSPESLLLVPGIGAQGGDSQAVMNAVAHEKLMVNVSRGIIFDADPKAAAKKYAEMLKF